jgi:hypothetical protein
MIFTLLHSLILWILQFYPYPELFVYPYLTKIGLLPYSQILDQHFPGLMFLPLNLYTLGFTTPESMHLLLILIVIINSVWLYKITKSNLVVLSYALWQPFFEGNQLWLDQFLPLFTLPSFWFFTQNNFIVSGLLLGLGVVFKQTLVPLVALVGIILLVKRKLKNFFVFGIASVVPSLVMLVYFYSRGLIHDFWYWTIQFNLSTYAAGGKLAPTLNEIIKLLFPVGLILVSIYILRKNKKAWLILGFLVFSIIGGVARFGFIHLQPAVPFFCLLLGLVFSEINKKLKILLIIPMIILLSWFYLKQTNLGRTRFFETDNLVLVSEIKKRTKPGEEIFLLGIQPHVYAQTQTVPAGRVFVFQFPWFLEVAGPQVLSGLKTSRPKLVVYDSESSIDGLYLRNYAQYLVQYITTNYKLVWSLGSINLYESRN